MQPEDSSSRRKSGAMQDCRRALRWRCARATAGWRSSRRRFPSDWSRRAGSLLRSRHAGFRDSAGRPSKLSRLGCEASGPGVAEAPCRAFSRTRAASSPPSVAGTATTRPRLPRSSADWAGGSRWSSRLTPSWRHMPSSRECRHRIDSPDRTRSRSSKSTSSGAADSWHSAHRAISTSCAGLPETSSSGGASMMRSSGNARCRPV